MLRFLAPWRLLPLALLMALSLGTTWNVHEDGSGDAPTINAAMDSASAGDTVVVWPGEYPGTHVQRANVHLVSQSGPDVTRLVADPATLVGEVNDLPTLLRGFTFTGALPSYGFDAVALRSHHHLTECAFIDGEIGGESRNLFLDGQEIVVRETLFQNNYGKWLFAAPGIFCDDFSEVTIQDCEFTDNGISNFDTATIFARPGSRVDVLDCAFDGRQSEAIVSAAELITIEGCLFTSFPATLDLSIVRAYAGTAEIRGNTFADNSRPAFRGDAGAQTTIENNVFANNATAVSLASPPLSVACNLVWSNGVDWEGIPDPTGTDGNVRLDPVFCNPGIGNYTVASNSPCLPENSNGCGLIGAFGEGCGAISVESRSWGRIKSMFR